MPPALTVLLALVILGVLYVIQLRVLGPKSILAQIASLFCFYVLIAISGVVFSFLAIGAGWPLLLYTTFVWWYVPLVLTPFLFLGLIDWIAAAAKKQDALEE